MAQSRKASAAHPATARHRAGLVSALFGLAAAPSAWIVQLLVDYGVSARVCHPGAAPRQDLPAGGEHALLLAINLGCLALALASLGVGLSAWRRLPADQGRARFLAACGLLSAAIFSVAILFDTPSALALRLCWSAPR